MTRQDELNEAWCKYMGKFSTEIMQALAFTLRWCDAHPHWIPVEDELPEVCVAVLTTTPHGTQRVGFYEDGWWLANTTDLVRMGSITHWMPLPQAPHHIIDANKKVDRVIGTADHIKTALDVLNKKGGKE
jgi:hypothetical protein